MATRKGLKARVTFIGPLLELDGKELGEFRNNRFEPSPRGEKLGLVRTFGSPHGALDHALRMLVGRLTPKECQTSRVVFGMKAAS
jgi:hypothetical protein